jgi:hypothetical protein
MKKIAIAVLICTCLALSSAFVIFVSRRVFGPHEQHRRQTVEGQQIIANISALSEEDVSHILIHDRYGREVLADVADPETQSTFLSAVSHMTDWQPNHPSFMRRHHVALSLTDGRIIEFLMCLKAPPDATVYVYGVRTEGNTTYYLSRKKSSVLKQWIHSVLQEGKKREPQQPGP